MVCTAGSSGVRRPPWEVLPSRRPIVQRPSADCEDDPEPGTRTSTSRKKGLAQGAAIRRHHQARSGTPHRAILFPEACQLGINLGNVGSPIWEVLLTHKHGAVG